MKFVCTSVVLFAIAGTANATTSTFYGTTGVDVITVGRGVNGGGSLYYIACINGNWSYGEGVTGSNDLVYVYGYAGADTIRVRDVNNIFECGAEAKWFYRMDYSYSCPATTALYGGTGNDVIAGAQCMDYIYGEAGADTLGGAGGNDSIYGGTENDCIEDTTLNTLICGDGVDKFTDDASWKDCETRVLFCPLP
jgi:Ca2+-binding RTX toxin-like protein